MYFAEFQTDRYIKENFFPDPTYKGIIVEIGAGPPQWFSTTKHFRNAGWRAICVDPNPKFVQQHKLDGSEIYQYACADYEGESNFTIVTGNWSEEVTGVSCSAINVRYTHDFPANHKREIIEVDVIPLNKLLENLNIETIDILAVDVEGWELDVMRGFDAKKYKPKVVVLENYLHDAEYDQYMNENGYRRKTNLKYNYIYERNE